MSSLFIASGRTRSLALRSIPRVILATLFSALCSGASAADAPLTLQEARKSSEADLLDVIREGAVLRVRPKETTVAVIIAGLVPILIASGTGSEIMQRIAAPMAGGMITAPLLSMFVVPVVYLLIRRRELRKARVQAADRKRTDYETV